MRSDELITAVRRACMIPSTHSTYTDAIVLDEINRTMGNIFIKPVTVARSGYWIKHKTYPSVALRARYRLPARACGIESARWGDPSGRYTPLTEATDAEIPNVQGNSSSSNTTPWQYDIEGDQMVLLPAPSSAGYTLLIDYYLRPSRLVTQQSTTLGGGTVRGQITAVDPTARTITVNVVPFDQELGTPAAITSANQLIDVVHPTGWHDVALVGASQTLAGTVFTVGGTDTMQDIEIGDFVRAAEQTDWPALADEWHQTLADATAVRIMLALGMAQKASALAAKIGLTESGEQKRGTDLARFLETLEPRVKNSPKVVARRTGIIHGRAPFWWRQ